uniref:ADP,ATP carrier protein n=1 Tax=Eutreptiella gymnastica TaxID=73025 RepID=A0A7S1N870_9EUGL
MAHSGSSSSLPLSAIPGDHLRMGSKMPSLFPAHAASNKNNWYIAPAVPNLVPWPEDGGQPDIPGADRKFKKEAKEIQKMLREEAKKRKKRANKLVLHRVLPPMSSFLDDIQARTPDPAEPALPVEGADDDDDAEQAAEPEHKLPDEFMVYLTAFLVNYDPEFNKWWRQELKYQMPFGIRPKYRAYKAVREQFVRKEYQEITLQLRARLEALPLDELALLLKERYEDSNSKSGQSRQLALLLSMLPKEGQAVVQETIQKVWAGDTRFKKTASHAQVGAGSTLILLRGAGFLAPRMLSKKTLPVYDESQERWVVADPSMQTKRDRHPFTPGDLKVELDPVTPSLWWGVFYLGLSGAISCMFTNAVVLPLDVLKTVQQTSDVSLGLMGAARQVVSTQGWNGLFYGFGAMMMNEFFLGVIMYPGVELGKLWLSAKVGKEIAKKYRALIVVGSTTMATIFSCLAQSPWEAAKIRIQAHPGTAMNCFDMVGHMVEENGFKFLFAGYVPLVFRSMFYNTAKFMIFDYFFDFVFRFIPALSAASYKTLMLLMKGFVAGVAATFASQPADCILTCMNAAEDEISVFQAAMIIFQTKGLEGFFSGFLIRALWSASKISMQFFCYDRIKTAIYDLLLVGMA